MYIYIYVYIYIIIYYLHLVARRERFGARGFIFPIFPIEWGTKELLGWFWLAFHACIVSSKFPWSGCAIT